MRDNSISARGSAANAPDASQAEAKHAVTAAQLVRSFAECREAATQAPLSITNHGRVTHVLMGSDDYQRLTGSHASSGAPQTQDAIRAIEGLAEWIDEAVVLFDRRMTATYANRVAHAISRHQPGSIAGKALVEAFPEVAGSLLEVHLRRTVVSSEPTTADIPSPFAPAGWLRMQSFPLGDHNVLMFRDITDEVERHRMADVKEAIIEAMREHGSIGYVRLSIRGSIDRVDQPFCDLIGLPEDRLISVTFLDLIDLPDRKTIRQLLESVMRGDEAQKVDCRFITNQGDAKAASLSIAPLHGAYGAEGAVIVLTPLDD